MAAATVSFAPSVPLKFGELEVCVVDDYLCMTKRIVRLTVLKKKTCMLSSRHCNVMKNFLTFRYEVEFVRQLFLTIIAGGIYQR